jgi:hypothetical protein
VRVRDLLAAVVLGVVAPVAGVGLLYLLRSAQVAGAGPNIAGSLPLEQLAGADAQPLARLALAWLAVGLVTGALLAAFTRTTPVVTLPVVAVIAEAVLIVTAGVSDAVAYNLPLLSRLNLPLHDAGTWLAVVFLVIGAAVAELAGWAATRAPSAA